MLVHEWTCDLLALYDVFGVFTERATVVVQVRKGMVAQFVATLQPLSQQLYLVRVENVVAVEFALVDKADGRDAVLIKGRQDILSDFQLIIGPLDAVGYGGQVVDGEAYLALLG